MVIAKVRGWFEDAARFFGEVTTELKKSAWPSRPELVESTVVVIICVTILGMYVGFCDQVLVQALRAFSRLAG